MHALAILIALGGTWCVWAATGDLTCRVTAVTDGDTFAACGRTIRLRAVDAPETTWRAECDAELAAGHEAARAVEALILGQTVELRDIDEDEDPFQRVVARAWVNGRDLGDWLLTEGYGQLWPGNRGWCDG